MQNPKTGGNRFNPDIRPSEIDTYTETNGEQTAEYKIINAHPIINGILNKLAFFRTHAAAVYYNRLANKTVKQKFDDEKIETYKLNEKLIPLNFNVAKGEDINDSKFCRFGFYSGQGLLNAPTAGWFQWLTFPLNGNIKYPAQLGFWIDNHTNNARMYTRAMSSATGSEVWSSWVEVITKNDVFFVAKTIVLPEGITTRGVFETASGFIDTKGRTLTGYCMKSARTGLEIHIQTLTVDSSGKCTLVYDKQSEQAFNIEIIFTFM